MASDNVGSRQADFALGLKYGCSPPPQLPNQWPLGIDWIRKLWHSDAGQHLLAFLCSISDDYEPRNSLFRYFLVGPRAFHILDLKNLEAVLSTNVLIQSILTWQSCRLWLRGSPQCLPPLLGNGIFTQRGPAWKHLGGTTAQTIHSNAGRVSRTG